MSNAAPSANPTTGGTPTAVGLATNVTVAPASSAPPTIHSTYQKFYGDEGIHPHWHPDYAPLLATMDILPTSATGINICHAIRNNQTLKTFSCMGLFKDPANPTSVGRIEVVHRLTYLSAPFGRQADPSIHEKLYGIVGDIMTGRQVAKVIVPTSALDATIASLIASDQIFNAAADSNALPETYGPYVTPAVDNRATSTRPLCFVTPHIASLIMGSEIRTPRGIIALLGPALLIGNHAALGHYASVFNWLRIAQTTEAGGFSIITKPPFVSAPPREEINQVIMTAVGQDLPMLGHAPIHQVGQQLTNAVGNFTAAFVSQNEADRLLRSEASQAKVMTLEKKYSFQSELLTRLLQITDLKDAPPVWHVIAANNEKKVRQILQTALDRTCFKLHLKPPVLHQALTRIIVDPASWRCADGPDNVLQGLSLFHVLLRPPSDELERRKAAASYDLAMSTGSSMTSQDTFFFNHPGHIDTAWVEPLVAKITLKHMWALCVTILGNTHQVSIGLGLALQRWEQYEMTLHSNYACSPDTWTMQVLYWFHRQLAHWIEVQFNTDSHVPFVIDELFSDISLGNNWSRGLPLAYIPARLLDERSLSTSTISGLTPLSATAPAPAPAPGATVAEPPPKLKEDQTVLQPATQQSAVLRAYAPKQNGRRIKAIIAAAFAAGNHIPKDSSNNNEGFCMSYHVTGRCSKLCRRLKNHRKLTDAEIAGVAAWCELAF
jgi:hypothetical protein